MTRTSRGELTCNYPSSCVVCFVNLAKNSENMFFGEWDPQLLIWYKLRIWLAEFCLNFLPFLSFFGWTNLKKHIWSAQSTNAGRNIQQSWKMRYIIHEVRDPWDRRVSVNYLDRMNLTHKKLFIKALINNLSRLQFLRFKIMYVSIMNKVYLHEIFYKAMHAILSCALLFKRTQVRYFGNSVSEMYLTQRDYKPVPFRVHHCQMSI